MKSSYAGVYNFIITNNSDIEKKQWETYLSFEAMKIQTQKFKICNLHCQMAKHHQEQKRHSLTFSIRLSKPKLQINNSDVEYYKLCKGNCSCASQMWEA